MIEKRFEENGGAARILEQLESRIAQRLPDWHARGPEDPARVILETFALSIAKLEGELEALPDLLLPRLVALLGEEARWAVPARSAVRFVPEKGLRKAVRVPRGTGITGVRPSATAGGGEARLCFETRRESWVSPAKLKRALSLEQDRLAELPVDNQEVVTGRPGGGRGVLAGEVLLFSRSVLDRHLYFGDRAWDVLRRRADEIVLEWPGVPAFVVQGRWEYSVSGGWRQLPVDFEESVDHEGERVLRMRIFGPLPDLVSRELQSAEFSWFRLSLESKKRLQWAPPRLAWEPCVAGAAVPADGVEASASGVGSGVALRAKVGRALSRVFSNGGERWDDHTFPSTRKVMAARPAEDWYPAVYLGWDLPLPASVYWLTGGPRPPSDWEGPRLIWEYSSENGYQEFEVEDDSRAFSRDGTINWGLLDDWTAREEFGDRLYWLRARWVEGCYYDAPRVRKLYPGAVEVVEGRTLWNHRSTLSFPRSETTTTFPSPGERDWERFETMEIEASPGDWQRMEHAPLGHAPHGHQFCLWRRPGGEVDLELPRPWTGDLEVRLPEVRVGLGGAPGQRISRLSTVEADIEGLKELRELVRPRDGVASEGVEELCLRVRAEWATGFRAVTLADFRRLVTATDPTVARVEVLPSSSHPAVNYVVVVARPPCNAGRISPARLTYLERYLQEKTALGTVVRVVEPCYVAYSVDVICTANGVDAESGSALEKEIRAFLHPLSGGIDGCGYPIGRGLQPRDIEPIIRRFVETSTEQPGEIKAIRVYDFPETRELETEESSTFVLTFPLLERVQWVCDGEPERTIARAESDV